MTFVVGMVATSDGLAIHKSYELSSTGRGATEHRDSYHAPALEYRSAQPPTILVDVEHEGPPVGEVRYLAQRGLGLFAVAEIDSDVIEDLPQRFYFSALLEGHRADGRFEDITLDSVAIVERSAVIGKDPAVVVAGETLEHASLTWANPHRPLLAEAHQYHQERRWRPSQPHRIGGLPRVSTPHVQHVSNGRTFVNGEPVMVRRNTGRSVSGIGPVEWSAHRGRILSVR